MDASENFFVVIRIFVFDFKLFIDERGKNKRLTTRFTASFLPISVKKIDPMY